jgi:hypothetical protein
MNKRLPPALLSDRRYYADHFMDLLLWQPYINDLCRRLGLACQQVIPGLPGSFPTFIVTLVQSSPWRKLVLKFFGPLFDGHASYQVERYMGQYIAQHSLPIASPSILFDGQLDDDWLYLVFEHIPGLSLGGVRQQLSPEALGSMAGQLGEYMRALHTLTAEEVPAFASITPTHHLKDFLAFLEYQRMHCQAHHQQWNDLPAHLLAQLPDFLLSPHELLDPAAAPHLVHADLTADHLLGRLIPQTGAIQPGSAWQSLAIIDWGDARLGNILYELVAVYVDLFHGVRHLLHTCLESYRLPRFFQHDFPRKALTMLLLHQFPMPATFYAPYHDCNTLYELADRLFA